MILILKLLRINVNLRRVAYCTVIREGGEREWDFVFARFKMSKIPSERSRLLRALGCSTELWLLNRYNQQLNTEKSKQSVFIFRFLHMSIDESSGIRKQDVGSVFSVVSSNTYGRDLAFDFLRENWTTIKN